MSTRPGYVGAYVDPAIKAIFVQQAQESGRSNTDFLNLILTEYLTEEEREEEDVPVATDSGWDNLGDDLREVLNSLILRAYQEVSNEREGQLIPRCLETLADILTNLEEEEFDMEDDDDFEDVLPEELSAEIISTIGEAIEEFDAEEIEEGTFFPFVAILLNKRADERYQREQALNIQFSREEWYYLDKLLAEANSGSRRKFGNLAAYIRYHLGEQLDYIGRDFLFMFPTDEEMVNTGQKMMSEATDK